MCSPFAIRTQNESRFRSVSPGGAHFSVSPHLLRLDISTLGWLFGSKTKSKSHLRLRAALLRGRDVAASAAMATMRMMIKVVCVCCCCCRGFLPCVCAPFPAFRVFIALGECRAPAEFGDIARVCMCRARSRSRGFEALTADLVGK